MKLGKLIPSTPEEYVELTTKMVKVTSEGIFHIQAMGASSMVYLLGILPEEGLEDQKELIGFTKDNLEGLLEHVVQPNIIEPKLPNEAIFFLDVVDLLSEQMELSGLTEEADRESFPDGESSSNS